jgi:hypothetical protein
MSSRLSFVRIAATCSAVVALFGPGTASAQRGPNLQKSANMKLVAHLPLAGALPTDPGKGGDIAGLGRRTSDIEIEQELSRPYAYITHRFSPTGFHIVNVSEQNKSKVIYEWIIENSDLHRGAGALNPMYFKSKGRYYLTVAFQFQQGGPDNELGAIVFDVTGLPDPAKVKEVGRIKLPDTPGGFHESFTYKHSDGRVLLFATTSSPYANVYDMEKFLAGDPNQGLAGRIPVPQGAGAQEVSRAYHDFYVGYDPAAHQDKFYGAGAGGYHVYDVTNLSEPKLLTSVSGVSGVTRGHTFTPTPDGRYVVGETEYRHSPLRIYDLKSGPNGTYAANVNRPVGAWTVNWKNFSHNHEVRWPYVFVSAFDDGLHVFNMMDPTNPVTVGFYDTWEGPDGVLSKPETTFNGAWGVDVRNADGLIVISDFTSGFWAFKMEGFDGWNGKDWGMPNVSSAQDWDNGPDGAPRNKPVTMR